MSQQVAEAIQKLTVPQVIRIFYHEPRPWRGINNVESIAEATAMSSKEIMDFAGIDRPSFSTHLTDTKFIPTWAQANDRSELDEGLHRMVVDMVSANREEIPRDRTWGPRMPYSACRLPDSMKEIFDAAILKEFGLKPGSGDMWGVKTLTKLYEMTAPRSETGPPPRDGIPYREDLMQKPDQNTKPGEQMGMDLMTAGAEDQANG